MIDASGMPIGGPIEHPHATRVLVLGVIGLLCCGVTAPMAWVMGVRALQEIDASDGAWGGRSQARLGLIFGVVGTVLVILGALFYVSWLLKG